MNADLEMEIGHQGESFEVFCCAAKIIDGLDFLRSTVSRDGEAVIDLETVTSLAYNYHSSLCLR